MSAVLSWRDGWQWFRLGFARYRTKPMLLVFWIMAYWTLLGLIGLLPIAGDILVAALAPVLMVGVLAGCRALDQEGLPSITVLFSGFGRRLQPLMGLGILHFLLTVAALALTAIGDGGVLLQYFARTSLGAADTPLPDANQLSSLGLLLAIVAYVPVMLAFAYAPLLVAWRGFGLGKALFFSFVASWRAWRAQLGFLSAVVVYSVLLPSLAMAVLMGLGLDDTLVTSLVLVPLMLILIPTIVSAFYSSYLAVLPEPTDATTKAAPDIGSPVA